MSTTYRNVISENPDQGRFVMQMNPNAGRNTAPEPDEAAVSSMIVRRGPQLMVIFAGRPDAEDVRALREANVKVGVALAQGELASVPSLEDYSYAFVSVSSFGRSPLQQALNDLATRNWVLDDDGDGDDGDSFDPMDSARPKSPIRPSQRLAVAA